MWGCAVSPVVPNVCRPKTLVPRAKEAKALGNILKVHGFGHPNLGRWIGRIRNETLILWGDQDRMLPAGQAKIRADRIRHARTHIVQNAGHFAMQDQPACLTTTVDFLSA